MIMNAPGANPLHARNPAAEGGCVWGSAFWLQAGSGRTYQYFERLEHREPQLLACTDYHRVTTDSGWLTFEVRDADAEALVFHACVDTLCDRPRGEYLALRGQGDDDQRPRVIDVHCHCDNHNRCAGCGGPLAEHRLSAYFWDEDRASVCYVAAYCGLSHRCA